MIEAKLRDAPSEPVLHSPLTQNLVAISTK